MKFTATVRDWRQMPITVDSDSPGAPRRGLQVTFIRHAEGTHNAAYESTGDPAAFQHADHLDALLTDTGRAQANALAEVLVASGFAADLVVASPLRRALDTARIALAALAPPTEVRWEADETVRECIGVNPCDRRSSREDLRALFPEFDFACVRSETDELWRSDHRETEEEMDPRCRALMAKLQRMPEKVRHVIVVSHGSFLRTLFTRVFNPRVGSDDFLLPFENCEARTVALQWE